MTNKTATEQWELSSRTGTNGGEAQVSPIRLWLVDDNDRMRATLAELLGRCDGIECTAAFSSPNALLSALASKIGPDVILLDIQMGDQNGLDAIRPIKSLSRSTRVLMLTTFFDDHAHSRAMADGASGFLLKRYPVEEILNSIRQAWKQPSPHPKRTRSGRPAFCTTQESNGNSEARKEVMSAPPANTKPAQYSRKRSLWVEHCLELLRGFRN